MKGCFTMSADTMVKTETKANPAPATNDWGNAAQPHSLNNQSNPSNTWDNNHPNQTNQTNQTGQSNQTNPATPRPNPNIATPNHQAPINPTDANKVADYNYNQTSHVMPERNPNLVQDHKYPDYDPTNPNHNPNNAVNNTNYNPNYVNVAGRDPNIPSADWTNQNRYDANGVLINPETPATPIIPKKEFKIIDNAQYDYTVKDEYLYPFDKLTIGQAFFIPLEPNYTIDKLVFDANKQAYRFRIQNSSIEKNEDGDEILENITIRSRLRNLDGSFKLDGDGNPKLSATAVSRPRLIGPKFIVKSVIGGDAIGENDAKAEADGVLVIRVD